jgi:HD-GYP domain-containing protein (c-di-GMP phosphodiesterase class II)
LLNRSGPLSREEYLEVIHHAEESVRILKRMGIESKELLNIIKHSHETLDGKGYPDGLTAAQIPAGSKIILVVDCYSALVSWRPYRESWDPIVAFDELSKGVRDGKYDARVVSALKAVIAQSDAIINKGSVTNIEAQPKTLPPVSLPSTGNIQKKVKKRLPTE